MSNNIPQTELLTALEAMKKIASKHEGNHMLAIAAVPTDDSKPLKPQFEVHQTYQGDPGIIIHMIVVAASMNKEFKALLDSAVEMLNTRES